VKIAAVCTAYHEADILPWTIKHLLAEGIDSVYIETPMDDVDTQAVALRAGAIVIPMDEEFHDQPDSINLLAALAHQELGDDLWILPFDADEFVYSPNHSETIRETLSNLPDHINSGTIAPYQQHDWWHCEPQPKLRKVFYRWHPDVKVTPGNHGLTGLDPDGILIHNGLFLREMQYRSFDHFCRKVEERSRTIDPSFGDEMGWHIRQHAGKSRRELLQVWDDYTRIPTIWGPIPSHADLPANDYQAYDDEVYPMYTLMEKMINTPCDIAGHLKTLYNLVAETETRFVIELGVNTGMSTIAFLAAGKPVHSVDYAGFRFVRPEVSHSSLWWPYQCSDMEWEAPDPCKLIFVDTSHEYKHTLAELERYWPLLLPGGAMAWHDTETCPEQTKAMKHWLHTVDDVARIDTYEGWNGMQVIWKRDDA
jgi:glycosyl transferase family 2/methyltransferase family protein